MTALLATLTASLFGAADFFGGIAAMRAPAARVTAFSQAIGLPVLIAVLALLADAPPEPSVLGFGAIAGFSGGIGVVALYAALARGRMSVVAPLTAALSGSLPAAFDIVKGSSVSPVNIVGIVLAVCAVTIVSLSPPETDELVDARDERSALGLAVLAGVGFAGAYIAYSFTGAESGLWPLLGARVTSTVLLGLLALVTTRGLSLERPALVTAGWAGGLDIIANLSLITAIHLGPLAVASVLSSLYPVVTVLLARFVLHERMRGMQRVGVALAFLAVVLAALP